MRQGFEQDPFRQRGTQKINNLNVNANQFGGCRIAKAVNPPKLP